MDVITLGHNLDSAPYLDIKFLDFQCAHCLCQLEKRDRSPNSLHLHCPNCSESGILERSTSLATECLRKGIKQDVSPTTLAKPCAEERRDIGSTSSRTTNIPIILEYLLTAESGEGLIIPIQMEYECFP